MQMIKRGRWFFMVILVIMAVPNFGFAQDSAYSGAPSSADKKQTELESRVTALEEKISNRKKDIWEIISSVSVLVSGIIIGCLGIYVTNKYNRGQLQSQKKQHRQQLLYQEKMHENELQIQQVRTIYEFLPTLQSEDEKDKEAAISLISVFNPELAAKIGDLYRTEGTTLALEKMALNPDLKISLPAKEVLVRFDTLEKEMLRKLKIICDECPDPDEEFSDYLFSGGPEYGHNITSAELSLLKKNGWVNQERPGGKIRITEAGRKAAQGYGKGPG